MDDLSTQEVLNNTGMVDPSTFAELKQLRMEVVQANRRNGTDVGMKKLLTDLYPGRAHFIYELIQNADDAGATEVTFELKTNRLTFSHNGKRLFNLDDIKSITNVGQSTKKDDGTTIGKFGIGFKSVYSYTSHPVINSGKFHFQIYEMMIPEEIDETYPFYSSSQQTVFILPFDLKDKPAWKSFDEIQEVLKNLSEETVLFLRNIKDITFEVSENLYEISKKQKDNLVELHLESPGKTSSVFYLKFSKLAKIETKDGVKILPVDIAYRLEKKEQKSKLSVLNILSTLSDKYQIVPLSSDRSVYVSFLAEKEHSGLLFCINSFFATTPSRDSIRDTDENRALLSELVKLQEESLQFIRDNGFLNIDFLSVLPNSKDNLSDFYRPFYDNVVRLFREKHYMISKEDSYVPANRLLSGSPSAVTDIFTIPDLVKLSGDYSYLPIEGWSRNSPQKSSRADIFITDLQIKKWGIDDFVEFLTYVNKDKRNRIVEVLTSKTTQQITNLYCLIAELKEPPSSYTIADAPIFKLVNGSFASIRDRIYLLEEGEKYGSHQSEHNFILPELYFGQAKKKEQVLKFLKGLDIGCFSTNALCSEILDKYDEIDFVPDVEEHINDIETLIKFHKFSPEEVNTRKILQTESGNYTYPNKIFIGFPYLNNAELDRLSSILGIVPLSSIYKDRLKPSSLESFLKVLKNSNVITGLTIKKVSACTNPLYREKLMASRRSSPYATDDDYTIEGLNSILTSSKFTYIASRLIWNFLLNVPEEYLQASYAPNRSCSTKHCDSQFVQLLSRHQWVLHSDGFLYTPEESSIDDLPDNWTRPKSIDPYSIPTLKAVGFGKQLESLSLRAQKENEACQTIGLPVQYLAVVLKAVNSGRTPEELDSAWSSIAVRMEPMPVDDSVNPERRKEVVEKEFSNAGNQERVIKERTVRSSEDKSKARAYLKRMYTDDGGYLRCQMCHDRMPFKKKDGEFYFEATQIAQNMKKEFPAQYLCLCPNCAAEYSEWIIKGDESKNFIQAILHRGTVDADEMFNVPIRLSNGKLLYFYFTQKHFIDISIALRGEYVISNVKKM